MSLLSPPPSSSSSSSTSTSSSSICGIMLESLLQAGLFGEDQCCKIKMPGGFVCGRLIIEHPTSSHAAVSQTGAVGSPGDDKVMFLVVLINRAKGKNGAIIGVTPIGTAFAISETHVLTSSHAVFPHLGHEIGLLKDLDYSWSIEDIIPVTFLQNCVDEDEDWAIFRRSEGTFAHYAFVCPENELPIKIGSKGDRIWIRDFPVNINSSLSPDTITLQSILNKVAQYEAFTSMSTRREKRKFQYIEVRKFLRAKPLKRALLVVGGRVKGSCGAAYFASNGKVVAFHVESLDDGTDDVSESNSYSSDRSYYSFSRGLVLCRLPKFMNWYEGEVVSKLSSKIASC